MGATVWQKGSPQTHVQYTLPGNGGTIYWAETMFLSFHWTLADCVFVCVKKEYKRAAKGPTEDFPKEVLYPTTLEAAAADHST